MIRWLGALTIWLALLSAPAWAAPQFPALTGRVVDDAHVLNADTQATLTAKLANLEQQTQRQLVVVTVPSLGGADIADYGYQLGRAWGIGQKGKNNGAVFIIAPSEHKVRIEVGYGLEEVLTDGLSSVILQRAVLPKFHAGDISGGIVDGTDAIISQLGADPQAAQAQVAAARQAPIRHRNPLGAIFPLIILFFIASSIFRGRGGGGGGLGFLLPMMILGGSRGCWGGGGGSGSGGGGFSGGGGSFGGGGSSGSW